MAGLLLIIASAFGADCSLDEPLRLAQDAVLALDFDAGHRNLEVLEAELECGPTEPADLARFWLISAALAAFEGDEDARDDALLAGRLSDESVWFDAFGTDLHDLWISSTPGEASSTIAFTDLPAGYSVYLDGKARDPSALTVSPGLHVLQVVGGANRFSRVLHAGEGDSISLSTSLPALPKSPAPEPEPAPNPEPALPPAPPNSSAVVLHLGVGFGALVGPGFDLIEIAEPAAKIGPMIEVGLVVRPNDTVWLRGAVAADFALAGRFVYLSGDSGRALPLAPSVLLSGGVAVSEQLDVGAMVGAQLPSRVPLRGVASYALADAIRVEGRAGLNLVGQTGTGGAEPSQSLVVEPAFGALATFAL